MCSDGKRRTYDEAIGDNADIVDFEFDGGRNLEIHS